MLPHIAQNYFSKTIIHQYATWESKIWVAELARMVHVPPNRISMIAATGLWLGCCNAWGRVCLKYNYTQGSGLILFACGVMPSCHNPLFFF